MKLELISYISGDIVKDVIKMVRLQLGNRQYDRKNQKQDVI